MVDLEKLDATHAKLTCGLITEIAEKFPDEVADLVNAYLPLAREVRALRAIAELRPLATRLAKSRAKYPNGATIMSLLDEAGEVAHAVNKYEPADRVREELLDVACVAMRLYAGEVDEGIAMDGLVQVRKDGEKRHG